MSSKYSQATKLSIDVPTQAVAIAPSERGDRVVGYDLARCLAFFGMVVVNYRYAMGGFRGTPDWLLSTMDVFTLRAAATFVMLAGVGMTLLWRSRRDVARERRWTDWLRTIALVVMLAGAWLLVDFYAVESAAERAVDFGPLAGMGRDGPAPDLAPLGSRLWGYGSSLTGGAVSMFLKVGAGVCGALLLTLLVLGRRGWGPRAVLLKRVVFLAAVGFIWLPLWGGDILRFYAIYLFAGVLVLTLRWPAVIAAIVAVLTAAFWLLFEETGGVPSEPFGPDGNKWTLEAMGRELFLGGFHPVLPWLAFLFVGVLVGRMNTHSWRAKGGLFALGLTLAVTGYAGAEPAMDWLRGEQGPKIERHVSDRDLLVAAESSAKPAGNKEATATVTVDWPDEFDQQANADFVSGAERLQSMLASGGSFASRSLSTVEVTRGAQKRRALVLTVSYGDDQPAPADHNQQVQSVQRRVYRWVRSERRARIESLGDAGQAQRWPGAIGLFAIERRLVAKPSGADGENESLRWDTLWIDTESLLAPSTGARWAGLVNPFGFKPGPGYMVTAMGVSLTVIALSLMLASFAVSRRVLRPLVVAGQMALTLYVGHVVIGFYVLKWIGRLSGENLTFIAFYVVVAWLAAVAFANWWRAHWRRGPLEAVMRWLTG
ncbi:MAG: putative membrane protein YeiB [Planctomycetota bacterium]|jgi:uncharacterized membrane protein YeiB